MIARARQRGGRTQKLINNVDGEPMTKWILRGAFDRARDAAAAEHPELKDDIHKYQFRDLGSKATLIRKSRWELRRPKISWETLLQQ